MGKKLTKKQLNKLGSECRTGISGIKIDLEYSIKLLEDYKGDLDLERKNLIKLIKTSKAKYKNIALKLEEHNKALMVHLNKNS